MRSDLEAARKKLTREVMGRPGISGTAVGERHGKPCLLVYVSGGVSEREAGRPIPKEVGGYPVVVETTGSFRAL